MGLHDVCLPTVNCTIVVLIYIHDCVDDELNTFI